MRTAGAATTLLLLSGSTTFALATHSREHPPSSEPSAAREIPRLEDLLHVALIERFPSSKPNNTLFLSDPDAPRDPVANAIYLQIANKANHPLYMGKELWTWNGPVGEVIFQLGDGEGDLTCEYPEDTDRNCPVATTNAASAWNIVGGIDVDYSGGWRIQSPTGYVAAGGGQQQY